jgi:hypothetical protein
MSITISGGTGAANAVIDATNGVSMATWTTTGRPGSPVTGQMGYNTTTGVVETWNGSAWTSFNNITTNLNFAAGVNGIVFNNNTSGVQTSSTLNDYETGTWTPAIISGSGTITSYTSQGIYTKIGNIVIAQFECFITNAGTASGGFNITGFPFTTYAGSSFLQPTSVTRESGQTGAFSQAYMNYNGTAYSNSAVSWGNSYAFTSVITYRTTF